MKTTANKCATCDNRNKTVFCDLSHEHLSQIDSTKTTNSYEAHKIIFHEGNQPFGLYCISSGRVKIFKTDSNGNQQIIRLAGPGDIIGYRCLLAMELYQASAETIEPATICFIDKKTFFNLLESHPLTASHVMKLLSKSLGTAEKQIANLVNKNVRERLAELFLVFKNKYGEPVSSGIKLNIRLTREELAKMIGTTTESVIRLISEFKQEEILLVKGREITLVNIPKLTLTANLTD